MPKDLNAKYLLDDVENVAYKLAAIRGFDTDDSAIRDHAVNRFIRLMAGLRTLPTDHELDSIEYELFSFMAYRQLGPTSRAVTEILTMLQEHADKYTGKSKGALPMYNERGITQRMESVARAIIQKTSPVEVTNV